MALRPIGSMMSGFLLAAGLVAVLLPGVAEGVEVRRHVVGAGAISAVGQDHEVQSTLGQVLIQKVGTSAIIRSGFWFGNPRVTDVDDDSTIPAAFRLYAARPNPTSAGTRLPFDLPVSGQRIQAFLYDIRGRQVRTLVDQVYDAGRHSLTWDGMDGRGRNLSSGTYFVVLRGPSFESRRKVQLVR